MNVGDIFRFDKTTIVGFAPAGSCDSVYREKWTGVIHMIENREEFFAVRLDGGRMRQTALDMKECAVVVPFDELSANELLCAHPDFLAAVKR